MASIGAFPSLAVMRPLVVIAAFAACTPAADPPPPPPGATVPVGTLRGRVVDGATRAAVPGAVVAIRASQRQVVTGADGRFSFDTLPAGGWDLEVTRANPAAGLHAGVFVLGSGEGRDTGDLALAAPGGVDVKVVKGATPVAGARVVLALHDELRSGADGLAHFVGVLQGDQLVAVQVQGGAVWTAPVTAVGGSVTLVTIDTATGGTTTARVHGRVAGPSAEAVSFLEGVLPAVSVTPDAAGGFASALPAGIYRVVARSAGRSALVDHVPLAGDLALPDLLLVGDDVRACGPGGHAGDVDGDGAADGDEPEACRCDATGRADLDTDGLCDGVDPDDDGDGVIDDQDNCPLVANTDQAAHDGDGTGDLCDDDDDGDGVKDVGDACPLIADPCPGSASVHLVLPASARADGGSALVPAWTVPFGDLALTAEATGLSGSITYEWSLIRGTPFKITDTGANVTLHVDAFGSAIIEVKASSGASMASNRLVVQAVQDLARDVWFDPVHGDDTFAGTRERPKRDVIAYVNALRTGNLRRELHVRAGAVPVLDGGGQVQTIYVGEDEAGTEPIVLVGGYGPDVAWQRDAAASPTIVDYGAEQATFLETWGSAGMRIIIDGLAIHTKGTAIECYDAQLTLLNSVIHGETNGVHTNRCPQWHVGNLFTATVDFPGANGRLWSQRNDDVRLFEQNLVMVEPHASALNLGGQMTGSARLNVFVPLGTRADLYSAGSLLDFDGNAYVPSVEDPGGEVDFGLPREQARTIAFPRTLVTAACSGLPPTNDVWADGWTAPVDCLADVDVTLSTDPFVRGAQLYDRHGTPRPAQGPRTIGPDEPVDPDGDGLPSREDPCPRKAGDPGVERCDAGPLGLVAPPSIEAEVGATKRITAVPSAAVDATTCMWTVLQGPTVGLTPVSGACAVDVEAKTNGTTALVVTATEANTGRTASRRVLVNGRAPLPSGATRVYVDLLHPVDGAGSASDPFNTLASALAGVSASAPRDVILAAGTYEPIAIPEGARLFGGHAPDFSRRLPWLWSEFAGTVSLSDSTALFDGVAFSGLFGAPSPSCLHVTGGAPVFTRCAVRGGYGSGTGRTVAVRLDGGTQARFLSSTLTIGGYASSVATVEIDGSSPEFRFVDFVAGGSPNGAEDGDVDIVSNPSHAAFLANRFLYGTQNGYAIRTPTAGLLTPARFEANVAVPLAWSLAPYREAGAIRSLTELAALAQATPTEPNIEVSTGCATMTTDARAPEGVRTIPGGACATGAGTLAAGFAPWLIADQEFHVRPVITAAVGAVQP